MAHPLASRACQLPCASGWSVIELMLVLACMAILTQWALPTFTQWQQRSQRSHARVVLMHAAQWLERSATANGRYPSQDEVPPQLWQAEGLRYRLQATLSDDRFTLEAHPMDTQADDACGTLTLTHLGEQGVQDAQLDAAPCWQR